MSVLDLARIPLAESDGDFAAAKRFFRPAALTFLAFLLVAPLGDYLFVWQSVRVAGRIFFPNAVFAVFQILLLVFFLAVLVRPACIDKLLKRPWLFWLAAGLLAASLLATPAAFARHWRFVQFVLLAMVLLQARFFPGYRARVWQTAQAANRSQQQAFAARAGDRLPRRLRFAALALGGTAALVGFGAVWRRGFYLDDYVYAALHTDFATGAYKFGWTYGPWRPVGQLFVGFLLSLMTRHEAWARAIQALLATATVALLYALLVRLTRDRLFALFAAIFSAFPIVAHQAWQWASNAKNLLAAAFAFAAAHCWLTFLEGRRGSVWRAPLALGFFALAALTYDSATPFIIIFPLISLLRFALDADLRRGPFFRRLGFIALAAGAIAGFYYVKMAAATGNYHARGIKLAAVAAWPGKIGALTAVIWNRLAVEGAPLYWASFRAGLGDISSRPVWLAVCGLGLIAAVVVVREAGRAAQTAPLQPFSWIVAGGVWLYLGLLPIAAADQLTPPRVLFFPGLGAAVAAGMAARWLTASPHLAARWAAALAPPIFLMIAAVGHVGLNEAYRTFYAAEDRLAQELRRQIPTPDPGSFFIGVFDSAKFYPAPDDPIGRPLRCSLFLDEKFDSFIKLAYRRSDVGGAPALRGQPVDRFDDTPLYQLLGVAPTADRAAELSRWIIPVHIFTEGAQFVDRLRIVYRPSGEGWEIETKQSTPAPRIIEVDLSDQRVGRSAAAAPVAEGD